ncbi:MAG: ComEC/Rec2 family competence protein [Eubacteriales bacterium]
MSNMRRSNRSGGGIFRLLLLLLICVCAVSLLSGCSDQVLNPNGTIGTAGETLALIEGSDAGPGGLITLPPVTEEPTEPVAVIGGTDPYENAPHRMYVDFLCTGASDCILIRMDDKVLLVDTGETDDYGTIRERLDGYGITTIDYLILTHYDNDHIGTAWQVLANYTVREVYMPDYVRASSLYRKLLEQLSSPACGAQAHRLYATDVELDLGYGQVWINATAMEDYAPGQAIGSDEDNDVNEENNYSLITSITFGSARLLLAGDAEQDRMAEFLPLCKARGFTTYDVIKIPHHGRSDDKAILSAIGDLLPRYCVVCTDSEASLSGALVTRMRAVGAGRYYTYDGTVTFSTDGTGKTMTQA